VSDVATAADNRSTVALIAIAHGEATSTSSPEVRVGFVREVHTTGGRRSF